MTVVYNRLHNRLRAGHALKADMMDAHAGSLIVVFNIIHQLGRRRCRTNQVKAVCSRKIVHEQ